MARVPLDALLNRYLRKEDIDSRRTAMWTRTKGSGMFPIPFVSAGATYLLVMRVERSISRGVTFDYCSLIKDGSPCSLRLIVCQYVRHANDMTSLQQLTLRPMLAFKKTCECFTKGPERTYHVPLHSSVPTCYRLASVKRSCRKGLIKNAPTILTIST
jgi:hypothetical protein